MVNTSTAERKKIIRITTIPTSLRILLKNQLAFINQYYDVIAVCADGKDYEKMIQEQGVKGYKINMTRKITPIQDFISLVKLIFLLKKEKPLIVHTHTPKAGTLGMIAARIAGVPHRLHTVAGLPLLVATGNKRRLLNVVEKITYACATQVYPNSFELNKIIIKNKLTHSGKLKVIKNGSSNGIDLSFFSPDQLLEDKIQLREKLKIPKEAFTFCFVGRMVKDKGIHELIHAFIRLYENEKNIHLLLIGPFEKELDPLAPDIEKAIMRHPAVSFFGFQNDIRPFLVASDTLVFPSYREGFPNVVMQAGAMGLPSIVTDINGCNEIIIPAENGMIIPSKDEEALYKAMVYFLAHPDEIKGMAAKARDLIASRYEQKMVWEALLEEYISLEKIPVKK